MNSSKESWFLYLLGFFLLCSGVLTKPSYIPTSSKDLVQERSSKKPIHPENFDVVIREVTDKNFTGLRSVFQWTIGETIDNSGIHNIMEFSINDSMKEYYQLFGQIGIYNNGSQIGVHLSLDSVASSSPGPSFSCSSNLPFFAGSHSCFNSNYSLISNAIYFLDVEIRGKTIRGYISEPQKDLTDIDDPYLPRNLIGEIKWFNELENLSPKYYRLEHDFKSCDSLNEITTFNYAPELYNKAKREKTSYNRSYSYSFCGPQNTLILTDWSNAIAIYISRPSPVINESRSVNSLKKYFKKYDNNI